MIFPDRDGPGVIHTNTYQFLSGADKLWSHKCVVATARMLSLPSDLITALIAMYCLSHLLAKISFLEPGVISFTSH